MPESPEEKKPKKDPITEIRSTEVQEIMGHVPHWMIRWGITLFFSLIVLLVFISYFIKYPDVVNGRVVLNTVTPAIQLVSKSDGQIQKVHVLNGQQLNEGDPIAEIENPLDQEAVLFLEDVIQNVDSMLSQSIQTPIHFKKEPVLGHIQTEFNTLKSKLSEFQINMFNDYQQQKVNHIQQQIDYHYQLLAIAKEQEKIEWSELENAKITFEAQQLLYDKNVISKLQFIEKKSKFNSQKKTYQNTRSNYLQTNITIMEYEKQMNELTFSFNEKQRQLKESIEASLNQLKSHIRSWEQNYTLKSPINGTVSFMINVHEKQFVQSGTRLFAVIPDNNEVIGYVEVTEQGFGKVNVGQSVNLKLDNYPSHEFGQLKAKVKNINLVPNTDVNTQRNTYLIKIELTNGMQSTYNKTLLFTPEMGGDAQIVTEDLRLIERIFNQFKSILEK